MYYWIALLEDNAKWRMRVCVWGGGGGGHASPKMHPALLVHGMLV